MTAVLIGIISGILAVLVIQLLKLNSKPVIYGQVLTGIGFLYVGFTWTDTTSLVITCIQALFFMFLAYAGTRSNINILIAGYFLHGIWDFGYHFFTRSELIPPHYDLFCLSIDFTMGAFLILIRNNLLKQMKPAS